VRRREFITLLGGAATASIAWPFDVRGQQAGKVIRIGFIGASLNSPAMAAQYQAFLTELHELGFSEGRNIIVDYRRLDDPRGPFAAAAETDAVAGRFDRRNWSRGCAASGRWCEP
jgi:hypothetical protein